MATNQVYAYSKEKTREWPVADGTLAGSPVLSAAGEPGVTITDRGDGITRTRTFADGTVVTIAQAPVGVRTDSAVVATDGTWALPVTGASAATPKNTPVYITAGGVLTLTDTGNSLFGVVDSYPGKATAESTAVKIGRFI